MDDILIKEIISANKLLDERRLREINALSASSGQDIFELVINNGYIAENTLLRLVSEKLGIEYQDIEPDFKVQDELLEKLPVAVRKTRQFLPLSLEGKVLKLAVADPMLAEQLDLIARKTGFEVESVLASGSLISKILLADTAESEQESMDSPLDLDGKSLEDLANEAPVIKLVNLIIMRAISEGASDIHIEPYEDESVVRYRIDGVLREVSRHSSKESPAIISRIKIMANLNIAERRIPQDGRISLRLMDRNFDLRVATIPVLHNEGVVMRILDKNNKILDINEMGFSDYNLPRCLKCINQPHGIFLLTGPTGSGKTTTLNAAISEINSPERKIITIEDPVEYEIKGVTQIHVNSKVGLTFATGLRSILRLDPDVVMVGEIRDGETAEIAIRTALTGHLVFSTLHTNSAPSAISRLIDMDVEPYLISSCLNAVLAQRLVRKVCKFCVERKAPSEAGKMLLEEAGASDVKEVVHARGCDECNKSGYHGRVAIHEFFELSDNLRNLINQKVSTERIFEEARKEGMRTLREDGIEKFLAGLTTAEEVIRVTQMD
jgi:type II secretory ATPase GspE/PulE/Tfp pilus assembly ATPase PilB-like protein